MSQQAVSRQVYWDALDTSFQYTRGRSVAEVLKGAVKVIGKYYPEATAGPFFDDKGWEPKIRIRDPKKGLGNIPIRDMPLKELDNILSMSDVVNIEYTILCNNLTKYRFIANPVLIEYSEPEKPPKNFRIGFMISRSGIRGIERMKRPYATITIWPASDENRKKLIELERELREI